ncbi:FISUMP domain-containing protein [Saccharicrinis sp. FJH54]|uniref:FISUMP domain-containing protein n=1 Tax=Saccharicrinis sp. FJH54 TaxID=3344665 RepID=UPI0035D446F0
MKTLILLLLLVPVTFFGQSFEFSIEPLNPDVIVDSIIFYIPGSENPFKTDEATEFIIEEKASSFSVVKETGFSIYPNPASDHFTVNISHTIAQIRSLTITDIAGRTIYQSVGSLQQNIELNNIVPGQYVMTIDHGNKNTSTSFLVQGSGSIHIELVTTETGNNSLYTKSVQSAIPLPGPWMTGRPIIMDIFSRYSNIPYQTVLPVTPKEEDTGRTYTFIIYACTDDSGKHYPVVEIGDQVWMAANMAMETDSGSLVYDSDMTNAEKFGMLYDWETAQDVCPDGWHLPSDEEWIQLATHLKTLTEDTLIADCLKMPEEWLVPVQLVPNVGFKALPAGAFYPYGDTYFYNLFSSAYFWTSDEAPEDNSKGIMRKLNETDANLIRGYSVKEYGFSVRCVKDAEPEE